MIDGGMLLGLGVFSRLNDLVPVGLCMSYPI